MHVGMSLPLFHFPLPLPIADKIPFSLPHASSFLSLPFAPALATASVRQPAVRQKNVDAAFFSEMKDDQIACPRFQWIS